MEFFNLIATPGLGKCKDVIKQAQTHYGQAELSINANPLNGNLFLQDFSKTFTIQGFQIDIGMVYNSQAKSPWRLNQGKTISPVEGQINEPNSVVILTDADGHENTYSYDSGRSCYVNRSEAGGCSTLTYTADNQWEGFNPATNIKELYNSNNQLVKITDSSGNDLTYAYDEGGRLKAIIGKSGNQVSIEYGLSENGLPETRIYFIEGVKKTLTMQYQFDDKNRLKKTLIPLNSNENYEINYAYDVRYGLLNNIEQSDETKASFDYEKEDNTYKLSELEDGVGNQYGVHYVENITQVTHNGAIEHTFTQNVDHLLQKHTHQEQENEYHYDADNRISAIDYKDGTTQQVRYDALGCYSEAKQRNGETYLSHRDLVTGLLLCETQVLVTQEGTRHLNTFYSYNDKQQLSFKVGPNGAVNAYTYDKNGNCICEQAYREGVFEVNALRADGRIVTENLEAWCKQQNQAAIALTEWSYNERGQKVKETIFANINPDGKGHLDESTAICEWEWDIHGKPLAKHTHLKRLNGQETPVETASETAEYDGLSRRVRGVDALKQVTRHVYHGNQQQTIFEPTGLSTTVSFDAAGNRIKQQEKAGELTNENHFTYDIAGRICIIETKNLSKEYRVYDEYNRVLFTIDAEMRATRHVYDINNRLTHQVRYSTPLENVNETILKEGKWKPTLSGKYCTESTLYDANGRLLYEINGDNFVIEHRYDSVGNRIETIAYATALRRLEKITYAFMDNQV